MPITVSERIFAIFTMLIASGLFGYTMNKIGRIFQNLETLS